MLPLLTEFKDELLREGLKPATIDSRVKCIVYFTRYVSTEEMRKISKKHIDEYKVYLLTEYKTDKGKLLCVETVIHRLLALKCYFEFLMKRKYIFFDPTRDLEFPKKSKRLPKYIPSEKDIEELLSKPDVNTFMGIRDRAVLELAYTCPLRNKELRELTVQDVDMNKRYIYPSRAKGGRECAVPIINSTYEVLDKYLKISRPRLLKGAKKTSGRLFLTELGEPFKQGTINELLEKYQGKKRIHPHLIRHACAVHMLRNGASIRDLQVLLGHRRIESTQIYTTITADDIKDLHDKYHPRERKFKRGKVLERV
jgi:integrase/recombinase XerD